RAGRKQTVFDAQVRISVQYSITGPGPSINGAVEYIQIFQFLTNAFRGIFIGLFAAVFQENFEFSEIIFKNFDYRIFHPLVSERYAQMCFAEIIAVFAGVDWW